ncbi:hypothetical protein LCGC14_3053830, partial [marine sediment metagenome]
MMGSKSPENACPSMYRVHQKFNKASITDIETAIREEFQRINLKRRLKSGQRAGITVGSRGIDRLTDVVATVVACLKNLELKPCII